MLLLDYYVAELLYVIAVCCGVSQMTCRLSQPWLCSLYYTVQEKEWDCDTDDTQIWISTLKTRLNTLNGCFDLAEIPKSGIDV